MTTPVSSSIEATVATCVCPGAQVGTCMHLDPGLFLYWIWKKDPYPIVVPYPIRFRSETPKLENQDAFATPFETIHPSIYLYVEQNFSATPLQYTIVQYLYYIMSGVYH